MRRKITVVIAALFLVSGFGLVALADHIPSTGPVPDNCANFQAGETGTQVVGAVSITLDSWDSADPHEVTFTIAGLTAGEWVDISVKSGTTVQEAGPYGNGQHVYANGLQNAISHIRLCVFGTPTTTTTTTGPTTTTTVVQSTTTTVVDRTTTTTIPEETTTTTVPRTTTTAPATTTTGVGTTLTFPTTTIGTVPSSVSSETSGTLPFTGAGSANMVIAGMGLMLLGGVLLTISRELE